MNFQLMPCGKIRQGITRAFADQSTNIRIPAYMRTKIKKIKDYIAEFKQEFGHSPSPSEIADGLGISIKIVNRTLRTQSHACSLNHFTSDKNDAELGDFVAADTPSPETVVDRSLNLELFQRYLVILKDDPLKQQIVIGRVNGSSWNELAEEYRMTQEEVKRLLSNSFRKFRNYAKREPHRVAF